MKVKVVTPCGYMELYDERMVENAKASYGDALEQKEIEVRNLMNFEVKSRYRVATPFGFAYTRTYGDKCTMERNFSKKYPEKKINFLDVH